MKKLAIIGASGHGKVIADIAVKNGYEEIVFLDDNPELKECAGFPVAGTSEDAAKHPVFDIINAASFKVNRVFDRFLDFFTSVFTKIFLKGKEREEDENE